MTELTSQEQIEFQRMAADAVTLALNGILSRQYLEMPWPYENYDALAPEEKSKKKIASTVKFMKLTQVGLPIEDNKLSHDAIHSILSFCHGVKGTRLVFVINHNGIEHSIYLGVNVQDDAVKAGYLSKSLAQFIQSNWPGTQVEQCGNYLIEDDSNELWNNIGKPINDASNCFALTGIPSIRDSKHYSQSQNLDRFMQGMQGQTYTYVVVAESIESKEIDTVITKCRDLIGQVHLFKEITLSDTSSLAESLGIHKSHNEGWTVSDTTSTSTSNTKGKAISLGTGFASMMNAIGLFFPVTLPFALFGAIVAPSISRSTTSTSGKSHSESHNWGYSEGSSKSISSQVSQSVGKKLLNAHAEALEDLIRMHIVRYQEAQALGGWNTGIYLCSQSPYTGSNGAAQLRALFGGEKTNAEPIRIHDLEAVSNQVQDALIQVEQPVLQIVHPESKKTVEHPLGYLFNGFTTLLNTKELALPINFPQTDVPGVSTISVTAFPFKSNVSQVRLGRLANSADDNLSYGLHCDQLSKHCLVAGINGSGKTNTIKHVLSELMELDNPVPFLIIEPAKDEYVSWAMDYNSRLPENDPRRISIFMPGIKTWQNIPLSDHLHLNPFEIIWLDQKAEPQILAHIDRLKSIIIASMPMQEVLPTILEDLIYRVYSMPTTNWLRCKEPQYGTPYPTLTQLLVQIEPAIREKGYEDRIRANLTAAMQTRIESLRRGWKQDLFDVNRSTPWQNLFSKSAVINLSQLGDDSDKCLVMSLILQFLYEYRQALVALPSTNDTNMDSTKLKHVTVIEEAHRVMMRSSNNIGEQAHPQSKVADMFANILSEIRAYGEGLIIADQVPGRLVSDAIKNTNIKIVHRLVANDDREAMAGCMNMTDPQKTMLSRLREGQAIVFSDRDDAPSWVQVPEVKRRK